MSSTALAAPAAQVPSFAWSPKASKSPTKASNLLSVNKNPRVFSFSATPAAPAAPAVSSSVSTKRVECGVCFDLFPTTSLFRIELCSNKAHLFCRLCHSAHLRAAVSERRGTPLQCMMDACAAVYCGGDARSFLSPADAALFADLERRWKAGNRLRYCAALKCGKDYVLKDGDETRFVCTKCKAANCAQCRTLWHAGLTCEKFQALPEQLRSPEDAHLLKLAQKEGWRQCPRCKNMIAKNDDDCKFVRCKCGAGFCFDCGAQYKSLVATDNNEHGEPSCTCGLWDETADIDEQLDRLDELDVGSREYWAFLKAAVQRRLPAFRDVINSDDDSDEDCDGHEPSARLRVFASPNDLHDLLNDELTSQLREAVASFKCWMCVRSFENSKALETHVSSSKKHAVLACCGVVFRSETELACHRALRLISVKDGFRMHTAFKPSAHTAHELDIHPAVERVAFHALDDNYGAHTHSSDEDSDEANDDDDEDDDIDAANERRRVKRALRRRRRRRDERGRLRVASKLLDSTCPHCDRSFSDPQAAVNHLKATMAHMSLVCCGRMYGSVGALGRHVRDVDRASKARPLCDCGRPLGHGNDDDGYDDEEEDEDNDVGRLRIRVGPNWANLLGIGGLFDNIVHQDDDHYHDYQDYDGYDDESYEFDRYDVDDEFSFGDLDPAHPLDFNVENWRTWPDGELSEMVSDQVCPYCERSFTSMRALQAHLLATKQHDVPCCCGRLFWEWSHVDATPTTL
jgi:hypothetical protein